MFSDLNVFKMAHALATHAGQRQAVISRNIANADTPGFNAREIEAFATAYDSHRSGMKATRAGHHGVDRGQMRAWAEHVADAPTDPNGNSVSIEEEMMKAVEVKREHDRALAIYRSSLNVLRASLGKR